MGAVRGLVGRVGVLARLDGVLFEPSGWFVIDAGNVRVPGVVVPSLSAGLGLVGRGGVASVVGRLRLGVGVVDVDLSGVRGHAVTERVVSWCRGRGVWCLVRPSGGADGRHHVFVATGGVEEELAELLAGLRSSFGVSRVAVDVRRAVRPVSAPHRSGLQTAPLGDLEELLAGLEGIFGRAPDPPVEPLATPAAPPSRPRRRDLRGVVAPLTPRRRRVEKRPLPPPWQEFLETGVRPVLREPAPGMPAHTRSTWEAIATASMVRAGWSAQEAWAAIGAAHPRAMDHARADEDRWVRLVWNRAVVEDDAWTPTRPPLDRRLEAAIGAAQERLRALAWSVPVRRRHALLLVGHAVLARMARTGSRRVPVPERDLVLDTGLADRKVIRAQLRLLDGPLGSLVRETFTPREASSSFEFEIPPASAQGGAVWEIPPPSRHAPLPRESPGVLDDCPPMACHLLRAALLAGGPVGVVELARLAQVTDGPTDGVGPWLGRRVRRCLVALAERGLVVCDADGLWAATARSESVEGVRAASGRGRAERAVVVEAERAVWRSRGVRAWNAARAAAAKREMVRQRQWWVSLPADERVRRREVWRARFDDLSVAGQQAVKTLLVERDRWRGVDPVVRHREWVAGQDPVEAQRRAAERAVWFAALAPPLQVAYAQSWEAHRRTYGIARGTPVGGYPGATASRVLPDTRAVRDERFLQDQLPELAAALPHHSSA